MTKKRDSKPTSSFGAKKATLSSAPKASGRWRDKTYKSASGHAMKGGRFKNGGGSYKG